MWILGKRKEQELSYIPLSFAAFAALKASSRLKYWQRFWLIMGVGRAVIVTWNSAVYELETD